MEATCYWSVLGERSADCYVGDDSRNFEVRTCCVNRFSGDKRNPVRSFCIDRRTDSENGILV